MEAKFQCMEKILWRMTILEFILYSRIKAGIKKLTINPLVVGGGRRKVKQEIVPRIG